MTKFFSFIVLAVLLPVSAMAMNFADRPDVKLFVQEMVKKHHFHELELVTLFNKVKVKPAVIKQVRSPLEHLPWYLYQRLYVSEWHVREGVMYWKKHEAALAQAEKQYGVPAGIIVATIGVETKYGKRTGQYRVMDALANLAFRKDRRATFFRSELKEFLLLTREQHWGPLSVTGSYTGAIGQPQFMPSAYRRYAVSFNGDKKIDLSHNELDIIASIAHYYQCHGWRMNQPVAAPVSLTASRFSIFSSHTKPVMTAHAKMTEYGINSLKDLEDNHPLGIISLRTYWGNEYWAEFHNFEVIKRYNASDLYAMAVFQLSHYISSLWEKQGYA
jgi:membrane-bound lytic murein transglycosylase B